MKKTVINFIATIALFSGFMMKGMHDYGLQNSPTSHFSLVPTDGQKHINEPLFLPKEISRMICNQVKVVDHSDLIEKNIQFILALTATCTHYNNRFKEFGTMLKPYDIQIKNALLNKLLLYGTTRYWQQRRSFLLLIYAGADHNKNDYNSLLERATMKEDADMVSTLFQHNADANLFKLIEPVFFQSKNTKIIQLFIDNGANLNTPGSTFPNVLWYCAANPELVRFYINKGVNPRKLTAAKKSILHHMSHSIIPDKKPETLKAIQLLLNTVGDMINDIDTKGKTALNLLIECNHPKQNIIALFKEHGAKTSQELKQSQLQ